MRSIRSRPLKEGRTRYQAEVRLKGHPVLTATFDRKTDAKNWIQKVEANIRSEKHQLYTESKKHTLKEAVEKYCKEFPISVAKPGHLDWWVKEIGSLYLQDTRPALISEKNRKLLTKTNSMGKLQTPSTCNRFLATLSHLLSVCTKQWE